MLIEFLDELLGEESRGLLPFWALSSPMAMFLAAKATCFGFHLLQLGRGEASFDSICRSAGSIASQHGCYIQRAPYVGMSEPLTLSLRCGLVCVCFAVILCCEDWL